MIKIELTLYFDEKEGVRFYIPSGHFIHFTTPEEAGKKTCRELISLILKEWKSQPTFDEWILYDQD